MPPGRHSEDSTFAVVLAQIVGAAAADVPLEAGERAAWLGERGLGLAPVTDPESFAWAGPWIGVRADDDARRAVLMFGVPSGELFVPDPETRGPLVAGYVVAPLDVGTWTPRATHGEIADREGTLEAIVVAPTAEAPTEQRAEAVAIPGWGLEGDRYASERGTFGSGRPGSALTIIDAAVLDELGPIDHRRNLVVRGLDVNALVGRTFTVGDVRCRGRRLAEPCAHLDRLNHGGVLRPLVHRGGLRADVESAGTIRVGDPVRAHQ